MIKRKAGPLEIVLSCAAVPLVVFMWAAVYSILWAWFVVPLGAPPIGRAHVFGLALIVSGASYHYASDDRRPAEAVLGAMFRCAFALLCGWIAHEVMS